MANFSICADNMEPHQNMATNQARQEPSTAGPAAYTSSISGRMRLINNGNGVIYSQPDNPKLNGMHITSHNGQKALSRSPTVTAAAALKMEKKSSNKIETIASTASISRCTPLTKTVNDIVHEQQTESVSDIASTPRISRRKRFINSLVGILRGRPTACISSTSERTLFIDKATSIPRSHHIGSVSDIAIISHNGQPALFYSPTADIAAHKSKAYHTPSMSNDDNPVSDMEAKKARLNRMVGYFELSPEEKSYKCPVPGERSAS